MTPVHLDLYQDPDRGDFVLMIADKTGGFRLFGPRRKGKWQRVKHARLRESAARELIHWAAKALGEGG